MKKYTVVMDSKKMLTVTKFEDKKKAMDRMNYLVNVMLGKINEKEKQIAEVLYGEIKMVTIEMSEKN